MGSNLRDYVLWNMAGTGIPAVIGLVVIPHLVTALGTERFGLLSVAWIVIGYFTVFDLGFSKALTRTAAERYSAGMAQDIASLTASTVVCVAALGVLGAALLVGCASSLSASMNLRPDLISEAQACFRWLGAAIPFVLVSTALTGLLEASRKFRSINMVRTMLGAANFLGPLAVAAETPNLGTITAALAAIRITACFALLWVCLVQVPDLRPLGVPRASWIRELVTFGGWLTVTNLISPLMDYFDRFLIAALAGTAAVTFYTVPFDALTRIWLIPAALSSALFPLLVLDKADTGRQQMLSEAWMLMAVAVTPVVATVVLMAPEMLKWWVGPPFDTNSSGIARLIAVGVWINSFARLPFTLIQARGLSRLAAKVHLIEFPIYCTAVVLALKTFGIQGAAAMWCLRVSADAAVFYLLAIRAEPVVGHQLSIQFRGLLIGGVALGALALLPLSFVARSALSIGALAACGILGIHTFRRPAQWI